MSNTIYYIYMALVIYAWLIVIRSLLMMAQPRPGTAVYSIYRAVSSLTEPYLMIFRRIIPKFNRGSVDWSVLVALVVLFVIMQLLRRL